MQPFSLDRPTSLSEAAQLGAAGGEFIAGGTDMVQLLKEWVRRPSRLVELDLLLDAGIAVGDSFVRIGAGARMEQVATNSEIARLAPVIAEALLESASPQVRNMATMGGNLLQRTRCGYFRDVGVGACNKRLPGSGCAAIDGENRIHAVLGTSDACIATHPSDLAVALVALDASLHLVGPHGERRIALEGLYRSWETEPQRETVLAPGEVITAIEIPTGPLALSSRYVKLRDRAAFEWALLSAAVALDVVDGTIRAARIAMGGVGTKPWRMRNVEAALVGGPATRAAFAAAARLSSEGAVARRHTGFKIVLMPKLLTRALTIVGESA
jgi:xanthine dehydrogenase YagS FAD-binding subunit